MSLEKVYEYFRHYDKEAYQVVACMGNEPSEDDIKDFEDQYAIHLPADFREFAMSPLGGLYMDVREEIWPQARKYDVGPFWSFCRGIIVYGIADDIPEFLDIRVRTQELHNKGFTDYIPFLSVIGNSEEIFCFDKNNKIVLLNYSITGEATSVEGDFSECLMQQIDELEDRKNKKMRGEDKSF